MKKQLPLFILIYTLVCSLSVAAQTTGKPIVFTAVDFKTSLDTAKQKTIIDVRTEEEFATGHIEGAVNVNLYDKNFANRLGYLDKSKPVYVYCKGGLRSAEAALQLQKLGFTNIYDLKGGIMAWGNKELPISAANTIADTYTVEQFDQLLADNNKILIDFYADWCLPCKKMEPGLRKLEKDYKEKVTIVRINVDEAKALTKKLNLEELPVLTTYYKGQELKRVTGFQTDAMMKKLMVELVKNN